MLSAEQRVVTSEWVSVIPRLQEPWPAAERGERRARCSREFWHEPCGQQRSDNHNTACCHSVSSLFFVFNVAKSPWSTLWLSEDACFSSLSFICRSSFWTLQNFTIFSLTITSSVLALLLRAKLSRCLWSQAGGVATLSMGVGQRAGRGGRGWVLDFYLQHFPRVV